jgi:hypothetical protein
LHSVVWKCALAAALLKELIFYLGVVLERNVSKWSVHSTKCAVIRLFWNLYA